MRTNRVRAVAAGVALAALALGALTGCGSSSKGADGAVTITVEGWRPGDQQATIASVKAEAAAFHKLHPNITVKPMEWEWNAQTFPAELAGGTLPTTFRVPFTDTKGLVERKQLFDVNAYVHALPYYKELNPTVLAAAQGDNGHVYGIPSDVYANALHYNRTLFAKAGLNPDDPPTTWAQLRQDAKIITQKTGQAGFAEMTKEGTGGWILTTLTYALGGRMETQSGSTTTATVDNPATVQALKLLHDMRWVDGSISANNSYDWAGINEAFAAGKIGMFVSGSDVYNALVTTDKVNPKEYGLAAIPVTGSSESGALGGGSVNVVSAKATAAQAKAAIEWDSYFRVRQYTDKSSAVAWAKTQIAAGQPVGTPEFPIFDEDSYNQYQSWIKSYVNVPLAQMAPYTTSMFKLPLISEPPVQTQGLYAALDPVVQEVLTNKSADIPSLLQQANKQVQQVVDQKN
jgi:ABC-type glycerol-3-phosphate transport system substrate-binding protein